MQIPVQVTFRNMDPSPAVEARVRERAERLERFYDRLTACRVVVECHHRHHNKGNLYHVRVDLTVPDAELVASREPDQHHAYEDVYVAVRDAFDAVTRQLQDHARRTRGRVKHHEPPPHGHIRELDEDGSGLIATSDGREIRFTRGALVDTDFHKVAVGDEVRFHEVEGAEEPTASTVHIVGKHHIVA